jgi:hypothetical protein
MKNTVEGGNDSGEGDCFDKVATLHFATLGEFYWIRSKAVVAGQELGGIK